MADTVTQFREYVRLDRLQTSEGLSPFELERWMHLKRILSQRFSSGLSDVHADKRRSIRVPIRMRVGFSTVAEMRGNVMTNLSRGGIFIATEHLVEIGTQLQLRMQIEATGESLEVPTEVASHNVGPNFAAEPRGMGLRFLEMDAETARKLEFLYHDALRARTEPGKGR